VLKKDILDADRKVPEPRPEGKEGQSNRTDRLHLRSSKRNGGGTTFLRDRRSARGTRAGSEKSAVTSKGDAR